jgi:hypothetical protein
MTILLLLACTACAGLAIAGHMCMGTPVQLVVITRVTMVLIATAVLVLVVIVHAWFGVCFLVARILVALIVGVVGVISMQVARLEALVLAPWGTLLVILLVVAASAAITKLGALAPTVVTSTMRAIIPLCVQPAALALVGKVAQLALVPLLQIVAHLTLCFGSNPLKLVAL